MIVICDNSAFSALAEAELLDLLPQLFGFVMIPEAVRRECAHPNAPKSLRDWINEEPRWLQVAPDPVTLLIETRGLGSGEAAAISLAWECGNTSILILDEKRGRRVAQMLGLSLIGVIGIIGEAALRGWLDFDEAVTRIQGCGFHVSEAVIEAVRRKL